MNRLAPVTSLSLLALLVVGHAQAGPMRPYPLPRRGPAPLLFVRFRGLPGMRVTFFQGRAPRRTLKAPVVVGMRPGYHYRVEFDNLPGFPGVSLFPSLEVFGTLHLPPKVAAKTFPATLSISPGEIEDVLRGGLITKVVYLEHPDRAPPSSTAPDHISETELPPDRDLLHEARQLGRPMIIFRMGQREATPGELALQTVNGTILYPEETTLPWPRKPPRLLHSCRPFYDPLLGKRIPDEEYIHDGGDRRTRAGIGAFGQVGGVDPEDTVAEFTNSKGQRGLTRSNRVCLLVPRFAALRSLLPIGISTSITRLKDARKIKGQQQFRARQPSWVTLQNNQMRGYQGQKRANINVNTQGPGTFIRVEVLEASVLDQGPLELVDSKGPQKLSDVQRLKVAKKMQFAREVSERLGTRENIQVVATEVVGRVKAGAELVSATATTRDLTVCCDEAPRPPDKPLVLIKCADRSSAKPGDIVTFDLRYSNHGGRPISEIAVTDSLSPRLEYIPNSAQSDRNAVFTLKPNESGSVILRWEITGSLQPGESGKLRFRARVR